LFSFRDARESGAEEIALNLGAPPALLRRSSPSQATERQGMTTEPTLIGDRGFESFFLQRVGQGTLAFRAGVLGCVLVLCGANSRLNASTR
jgi:hypothetical protein